MFNAYQIEEHQKPLKLRQLKKPTPTGHELLVKTKVSGVCHSDVHIVSGDWGVCKLPLTPGHEGIGIVEAVGSAVTQIKVGDRVGMAFLHHSCLNCHLCKSGRQNICENQNQSGFTVNGTFGEYFVGDERFVAKIPDNYSDAEAAPILCAGITSYKAVLSANAKPGARIVISGSCGGLGHLAIQYAKAMGYEVVALDFFNDQDKETMCRRLGADFIVHCSKENGEKTLLQEFKQLVPQKPIEAAIVFAPVAAAVSDAVSYVSPGGTIVPVGIPSGNFQISALKLILKELKVQGSIVGTPSDLKEVFLFSSKHNIKPRVEEKEMKYVNDVIHDLKDGKISGRVVLTTK